MKWSSRFNLTLKETRRWLAAGLAFVLIMTQATGIAAAADATVTGINFDYHSSDYDSSKNSIIVFVDDDKVILDVEASMSDSSNPKIVTADVVWKSSNTAYVTVAKGVLTGVGKGAATISATYKGFTQSIKVTSDYVYDSVTIMEDAVDAGTSNEIELGQKLSYSLIGKKSGNEDITVTSTATWSTSNAAVAKVDDGNITLVGPGIVTITAKLKGKSDSIKLIVSSPYNSISVQPALTNKLLELKIGEDDERLTAWVDPKAAGDNLNVTDLASWVSGNSKIVTVDKGIIKAVSAGKTTITVSHLGVTTTFDVVARTMYQSIQLSPEKEYHMLLQDQPLKITAEVRNISNESEPVTTKAEWTSSDILVATVSEGKVTPHAAGTAKITAKYKGVSRSIDVVVYPSISELSVEVNTIDGFPESTGNLPKVTATLYNGEKLDVTKLVRWTSSDELIGTIKDNLWTGIALGETILTASVQDLKVDVTLKVHVKPLKLIAAVKEMSIVLGKEVPLPSVIVVNTDGEEEDVTKSVVWKTTSDNIVLKPSTMKGIEASTLTLTGTYLTKTVTIKVKVEEEIVKLVVEPTTVELNPGKSKSIKVTGYYKSGITVSLGNKMNWESGNVSVATVNGASVKAIAVGTTKLSGSYQGKTVVVPVVVTPKLKSLLLSSKSVKLSPGSTYSTKLQANYYTGSPIDATAEANWTSSNASVATVNNGTVTAVSKGSASIKAAFGGKTVTIRITVK